MDQHLTSKYNSSAKPASGSRSLYGPLPLTQQQFTFFSELLESKAGIVLPADEINMMENRLKQRLVQLKLNSYAEYEQYLQQDLSPLEMREFINTFTTNETEFFRERCHFEQLRSAICALQTDSVSIWSAGCSSGEEVYSLAIACENLQLQGQDFHYQILGTDIDAQCLSSASQGIYQKEQLHKVSRMDKHKYFCQKGTRNGEEYVVSKELRRFVKFRAHNLIDYKDHLPIDFNFIFLCNVLYSFSKQSAAKIVKTLVDRLMPGGLLFVGLAETLQDLNLGLVQVGSSVYQKRAE